MNARLNRTLWNSAMVAISAGFVCAVPMVAVGQTAQTKPANPPAAPAAPSAPAAPAAPAVAAPAAAVPAGADDAKVAKEPITPGVREVAAFLSGAFDTVEQAKADPEYFEILLHMTPIWTDRTDGVWLYVEQAMAQRADKPYRQRVYRLVGLEDGRVRSEVFELPGEALAFAGAYAKVELLKDVTPEMLTPREGCALTLGKQGDGTWKGATGDKTCASSLRGASYATSEATIMPAHEKGARMVTWDRGYDAQGTQVWGAVKGGYEFVKRASPAAAPVSKP
ncbi:MAG: chromophore lyase CpcT/CpeT [Phycisphaerales bacterium]|jgi:CpeT protein|nr:chromophore lyase CpcT/CpeT [Phycisphaeraceae bacterium]